MRPPVHGWLSVDSTPARPWRPARQRVTWGHIESWSSGGPGESLDPGHRGAQAETGEVAVGSLVVSGRDASPCCELVDQAFDGVPLLVEIGVVADGPSTSGALLLPVGGSVLLLRDDRLDTAFARVGAVSAGRVRLVPGDRVRPDTGSADGPAYPCLLQDGDDLRAVRCLACGQDERRRAALAVGGEVDLAGMPASRTSEEGGLQSEFPPTPDASSFFQRGTTFGLLPALRLWTVDQAPNSVGIFSPLPARLEPSDHALELLPQSLGVRAVLADRQVPLDQLPIRVGQLQSRHVGSSIGPDRATKAHPAN